MSMRSALTLTKALGLLVLVTSIHTAEQVQATGARIVFNSHLATSIGDGDGGISFLSQSEELPIDLWLANKDDDKDKDKDDEKDKIKCSEDPEAATGNENKVLLVFSSCVEDSALRTVETWAQDMQKIVADSVKENEVSLNFNATMVPGACTTIPLEAMAANLSTDNASALLLGQEVPERTLQRLNAFNGLGDIQTLESVAESADTLTAVISFATDDTSYNEIITFESLAEIVNMINFQVGSGMNCEGKYGSCIELKTDDDIFMYNPFTVTHAVSCENLENGVPVTLVDSNGKRQCFCGCPAGYEMKKDGNKQVCEKVDNDASNCVWSKVSGYKHQVSLKSSVCSFTHVADNWGIPMPLPTSGISSSELVLLADATSLDPRVSLSVVRVQDPEYYAGYLITALGSTSSSWPLKFQDVVARAASAATLNKMVPGGVDFPIHDEARTWKDYQSNCAGAVNSIVFSDYGKYRLEMNAFDYYSSAKCTGCLVILDSYRPQATTECPSSFCDSMESNGDVCGGKAELTMDNVAKADGLIKQYFDFGEQADNDGCSVNNRCDLHQHSKQNFFETKYSRYSHDESISCFDPEMVLGDFMNSVKATTNPLKRDEGGCHDVQNPIPAGQCTRCCKMTTALREFWTDYRCGSDYEARYCEGDSDQTCTHEQCLVMNGDTLATVSATITPDVIAESEKVIQQLNQGGYQTVTQVHRALECTSFYGDGGQCVYMAKLSELVDTTQTLNFAGDFDANEYVHWRFKVNGDSEKWQLWKTRRQTSAETGCNWADCEAVYDDDEVLTFSDPETKISIEAWTQCGLVRSFFFYVHLHANSPVDVCSQFSNMWYQTSVSRLPIAAQMCAYPGSDFAELTFDFHPNAGLQYSRTSLQMKVSDVICSGTLENRSPTQLLKVTEDSPEIVTRFAVEMLHRPNTEALTTFDVSCDFKYVDYSGSTRTKTCGHSFSIADCKGPQFDPPNAKCEYDACAGNEKAGLYEVCGGTVVRSTESETYVELGDKECCQGCEDTTVVCTGLLSLPDEDDDLMRCEPESASEAYHYYFPVFMLAQATQNHPVAMVLLSASVLTVALALVLIRRRESTSRAAQVDESDISYPLLYS